MLILEDASKHRDMLLARVQALQKQLSHTEGGVVKLTSSLESGMPKRYQYIPHYVFSQNTFLSLDMGG